MRNHQTALGGFIARLDRDHHLHLPADTRMRNAVVTHRNAAHRPVQAMNGNLQHLAELRRLVYEQPAGDPAVVPCQHSRCQTLTLGRDYCAKHRHLASASREREELRPC